MLNGSGRSNVDEEDNDSMCVDDDFSDDQNDVS